MDRLVVALHSSHSIRMFAGNAQGVLANLVNLALKATVLGLSPSIVIWRPKHKLNFIFIKSYIEFICMYSTKEPLYQ